MTTTQYMEAHHEQYIERLKKEDKKRRETVLNSQYLIYLKKDNKKKN